MVLGTVPQSGGVDGRSRVGTWMVNDAAERQVALEGVGGFKNTTSSNIVGVAPTVTLLVLHQR